MKTTIERVEQIHLRAKKLERQRDRRRIAEAAGASLSLLALLVAAVRENGLQLYEIPIVRETGASLLNADIGLYVLVAVIAFMLGVAITAYLKWRQSEKEENGQNSSEEEGSGGGSMLMDDALLLAAGGKKENQSEEEKRDPVGNTKE